LAWEPLWLAATAADLPIHFHAGSGDVSDHANSERSTVEGSSVLTSARQTTDILLTNAFSIADLLSSGVLVRHPELKFVSVESGVGWIPFVLESLDRHFEYYKVAKYRSEFELLPSEYFRRQVYTTVWFEELTDLHLATVGADNIMFETDYPHPTCLMGQDIQAAIDRSLGQLDERNRRRILSENAARLYGWESQVQNQPV
jgi:predicted TIM-barrel fold metal-dependent hydrolase